MTCVTSHLTVLMKKRSFMKMYFHKHCDGQNHQGSLIMEDVASDVFNYVMDGNIFINYLRDQFMNVEQLQ